MTDTKCDCHPLDPHDCGKNTEGPMTDTIRSRHQPDPDPWVDAYGNETGHACLGCEARWPCDTAIETARADKAEAASFDDAAAIQELGRDLLAANADAEALAEALQWCGGSDDFADGGKARLGWERVVQPALDTHVTRVEGDI